MVFENLIEYLTVVIASVLTVVGWPGEQALKLFPGGGSGTAFFIAFAAILIGWMIVRILLKIGLRWVAVLVRFKLAPYGASTAGIEGIRGRVRNARRLDLALRVCSGWLGVRISLTGRQTSVPGKGDIKVRPRALMTNFGVVLLERAVAFCAFSWFLIGRFWSRGFWVGAVSAAWVVFGKEFHDFARGIPEFLGSYSSVQMTTVVAWSALFGICILFLSGSRFKARSSWRTGRFVLAHEILDEMSVKAVLILKKLSEEIGDFSGQAASASRTLVPQLTAGNGWWDEKMQSVVPNASTLPKEAHRGTRPSRGRGILPRNGLGTMPESGLGEPVQTNDPHDLISAVESEFCDLRDKAERQDIWWAMAQISSASAWPAVSEIRWSATATPAWTSEFRLFDSRYFDRTVSRWLDEHWQVTEAFKKAKAVGIDPSDDLLLEASQAVRDIVRRIYLNLSDACWVEEDLEALVSASRRHRRVGLLNRIQEAVVAK